MQAFGSQVTSDRGNTRPIALAHFGSDLLAAIRADEAANDRTNVHYLNEVTPAIASLDLQKSQLRSVRHDLEQLQTSPSATDQLKLWIDYGSSIEKNLQQSTQPSK